MKKLVLLFAFFSLATITFAQEDIATVETSISIKNDTDKLEAETKSVKKGTKINSAVRTQLLKINRKKSKEIISIKAYRKSLQIKVKTVKLC